MKKKSFNWLKKLAIGVISLYLVVCSLVYFFQEKMLFHPEEIPKSTDYKYDAAFEETFYEVEKGIELNTLLFTTDSTEKEPKKLIFFIHGNGGTLKTLGGISEVFNERGYDCFLYDYRGYGKSDGTISSEEILFSDARTLYNAMKKRYTENNIIIVGYSIGTGIAAWLASENHPKALILEAPYYSMVDMMKTKFRVLPTFLLRYRLETNNHLKNVTAPIAIFHGTNDKTIPYSSSVRLKKEHPKIELIPLEDVSHVGLHSQPEYLNRLDKILN